MADEQPNPKAPKDRSPSFPFIPLSTAIDRLVAFEETFKRHPAPASKAGLAWEMKPGSSQAGQTLAALKSFGLIEYQGSSAQRVALLSDDGRNYLRAQQDAVKREILRRLALKPKAIERYWHEWGADRPIDPICLDELVLKGAFTESAARTFLRVYDSTIAYAGLADSDKSGIVDESELADHDDQTIELGDLVQVEVNGSLLEKSAVVRAIQGHGGKEWVFIAGSETGIPMENVRLERKGAQALEGTIVPPVLALTGAERDPVKEGWKEERLLDDKGGEIFIRFEGEPSLERYEFIRDYLDFKLNRAKPKK